jgi:hypothetical protein
MRLLSVLCLAAAGLALPLGACEEKKSFKHDAEWAAPAKTPRAAHTDTPEGTAEAIADRLDDILDATHSVNGLQDTARATTRMRTAYADIETYYARLKTQEPKADGPNRIAVARYFFKGQQELAKSVADLFEQDPKIVEVISAELATMTLVQDPPDPLPEDERPGLGIEKEIPVPEVDNPKAKATAKPKGK